MLTTHHRYRVLGKGLIMLKHAESGARECHPACRCAAAAPRCANAVLTKGLRLPLEVFRTKHKGW